MPGVFLTAEWRKLAMANYPVDPASLRAFVPPRTELDYWDGEAFVSLVGFQFRNVRVKRLSIPFHRHFPEVNLRFYVRYKVNGQWKRGVVFIREVVPLPAVSITANVLFRERYLSLPMRFEEARNGTLNVSYAWKFKGRWNSIAVETAIAPQTLQPGSQEEFITAHFWGFAKAGSESTNEYQVAHPRWDLYPVKSYSIDCDFEGLYGPNFAHLGNCQPQSVFLAEGSPVEVYSKSAILY
jgi:uncharacterized protein YqjF (DUF2071 family)